MAGQLLINGAAAGSFALTLAYGGDQLLTRCCAARHAVVAALLPPCRGVATQKAGV